jgi:type II secretory pathway component PulF
VSTGGGRWVSLDQLAALNDLMAALIRAGVPLETGLGEMGRDLPGRLGTIAERLSQRMEQGENLEHILATDSEHFPPVWRAAVLAGVRSGHLAVALEGLSETARRVAEHRRSVVLAMIYPLIVTLLAYGLLLFLLMRAPLHYQIGLDLSGSPDPLLAWMAWLGETAGWVLLVIPMLVAVSLAAGWYRLGRFALPGRDARPTGPQRFAARWPSLRRAVQDSRLATFAEILSLLLRQQVPLDEALVLSAEASGDRALAAAARDLAGHLQSGQPLIGPNAIPPPLPRLLGWMLASGMPAEELGSALAQTAETYRERSRRGANWAAVYLPILLTVFVGGTATLLAALAALAPVWRLLYTLGQSA